MEYSSTKTEKLPDISNLLIESDSSEDDSCEQLSKRNEKPSPAHSARIDTADSASASDDISQYEINYLNSSEPRNPSAETPVVELTVPFGSSKQEQTALLPGGNESNPDFLLRIHSELSRASIAKRSLIGQTSDLHSTAVPHLHTSHRGEERLRNKILQDLHNSDLKILLDPLDLPIYNPQRPAETLPAKAKPEEVQNRLKDSASHSKHSKTEAKNAALPNKPCPSTMVKSSAPLKPKLVRKIKTVKTVTDSALQCSLIGDESCGVANQENIEKAPFSTASSFEPEKSPDPKFSNEPAYRVINVSSSKKKPKRMPASDINIGSTACNLIKSCKRDGTSPCPTADSPDTYKVLNVRENIAATINHTSPQLCEQRNAQQKAPRCPATTAHASELSDSKKKYTMSDKGSEPSSATKPKNTPEAKYINIIANSRKLTAEVVNVPIKETQPTARTSSESDALNLSLESPTFAIGCLQERNNEQVDEGDALASRFGSYAKYSVLDPDEVSYVDNVQGNCNISRRFRRNNTDLETEPDADAIGDSEWKTASPKTGLETLSVKNKLASNQNHPSRCTDYRLQTRDERVEHYEEKLSKLHDELRDIRALLENDGARLTAKEDGFDVPTTIAFALDPASSVCSRESSTLDAPIYKPRLHINRSRSDRKNFITRSYAETDAETVQFSPNTSYCDDDSFLIQVPTRCRKTVHLLNPRGRGSRK